MKTMKFGILGAGHIATKMANAVKVLEQNNYGVIPYAVASRSKNKSEDFAQKHGFTKAYATYEQLIADPEVDLIYIATPHSHHFEWGKKCIEAGKNILVEKAFCANSKQASVLIDLAKDKGVFMCEAMWTRFLPAVEFIRNWIQEGRIGTVESIEADFSMPLSHIERLRNPALAGGALLDLGIYSLTFADLFANSEIEFINSKCIKYETGVDASDWIELNYRNGVKAHLKTSMVAPCHNEGSIYGTKGFIWVQNLNDFVEIRLYDINGNLVNTHSPTPIANFYEYEVLACKKALENSEKECAEMPHQKTMEMMEIMDNLRNKWGVFYPFENAPYFSK